MYTHALGGWSRPIIATAAFITMLSTTITVVDGVPRVTAAAFETIWPATARWNRVLYWGFMIAGIGGTMIILAYFTTDHMRSLVDFVTTLAFLSAPLLAYIGCRVNRLDNIPKEHAAPAWLRVLSWSGLAFLTGFSILYIVSRLRYGA
jgi:Mn2+/Fe2+ NRAMP family transporter